MRELYFKDFSLSDNILKALDKLGYKKPSKVQQKVIPYVLKNMDVIVKSQTGSGKTAAFGIPLCEKVDIEERNPQALVLTPTRELAVQIKEEISNIGRLKKVRSTAIFGKQPMNLQKQELKQRVHVVVGTPGRTLDHIDRGSLNLEKIKYFIIDEGDEMLNMGFIQQVKSVIEALPKDRVTMLFSATINEEIQKLCKDYMVNPESIEIEGEAVTTKNISQFYYEVDQNDKFQLLNDLIYTEMPKGCILFCNTKDAVDNLFSSMKYKNYSVEKIHGGMEQAERLNAMKAFKRGEFQFLVATDVAGRGIDIEDITHVINYDMPFEKESYVHRIGRTGRAGAQGKAITFVCQRQVRFLDTIEEFTGESVIKMDAPPKEKVEQGKIEFENNKVNLCRPKKDKGQELNKEITKIYIGAGKKKKVRAGDIVGAISNIDGITAEHIGIIDVQDNFSYVDILENKGKIVIKALKEKTIKGKKVKIEKACR